MAPLDGLPERQWGVAEPGRGYLVYSADGSPVALDLPAGVRFAARWIDPRTGATRPAAGEAVFRPERPGPAVLWVTRD
jgi:hypothetical protein